MTVAALFLTVVLQTDSAPWSKPAEDIWFQGADPYAIRLRDLCRLRDGMAREWAGNDRHSSLALD